MKILEEKIKLYDLTDDDLKNIYEVADQDIFDNEDNCFVIDLSNEDEILRTFDYIFEDSYETEEEAINYRNLNLYEKIKKIELAVHIVKLSGFANGIYLAVWK